MAKIKSFEDGRGVNHPEAYWKIIDQKQDFLKGGAYNVVLAGWHNQTCRDENKAMIGTKSVVIPNFALEETDDIRDMLYDKLADNSPFFVGAETI